MKKWVLCIGMLVVLSAYGATAPRGRNQAGQTSSVSQVSQSARAARSVQRTGRSGNSGAQSNGAPTVAARSAVTSGAAALQRGRETSKPVQSPQTKSARVAKQNVINTGTKILAANQTTVVDDICWNKFSGCMDSFCMLDNVNGGRCACSNKSSELDDILAEIKKLDYQSYQMATVGVEQIQMGENAQAIMAKTESITKGLSKETESTGLDLSLWNTLNTDFDGEEEEVFKLDDIITSKTGDALYFASFQLCKERLPECSADLSIMDLMYKQRVRSDCAAYENSLNQQQAQSAQKLAAAQGAMREAALEQYRNQNKYDLGQCTIMFKQCMQTTAGCGEDFASCVTNDYTVAKANNKKVKTTQIKGAKTTIEIATSTYEVLESKIPLCMTVTDQCVSVRDEVWDTFLREAAPEIKSAELIAESNLRTSCVSKISQCFQKACKDNIDPNDPDGSYDMCLTRPETLFSLCKAEVDPCKAVEPEIMDFVLARLASMRVDSCTREFKSCLMSEDRCGADYTQCIGLDTDTIVRMCPADKLTGCQYKYKGKEKRVETADEIYDELALIAEGIFLNIDNNMLTECQKAADAAMLRVCGSTENCDDLVLDEAAGTRSFQYQVCQYNGFGSSGGSGGMASANTANAQMPKWTGLCYDSLDAIAENALKQEEPKGWAGKLSGLVYWGDISYDNEKNQFTTYDEYIKNIERESGPIDEEEKNVIKERVFGTEIKALTTAVETAIKAVETDTKVQFCMTGRTFQGLRDKNGKINQLGSRTDKDGKILEGEGRFPNLTRQMRQLIATSALRNARENYMKKYDTEMERMMKDQVTAAKRIDAANARAIAKEVCGAWAQSSELPVSKAPKTSNVGKWIAIGIIAVVSIVASIVTFGGAAAVGAATIATIAGTTVTGAMVAAGVAVGAGIAAAEMAANVEPVGKANVDQWNFKQTITTLFNEQTGVCTKETISQNCGKVKKNYCKKWDSPETKVTSIDLIAEQQ